MACDFRRGVIIFYNELLYALYLHTSFDNDESNFISGMLYEDFVTSPSFLIDNIRVMVIAWRLRRYITRAALCRIVSSTKQFLQIQQIGFITLGPLRHA